MFEGVVYHNQLKYFLYTTNLGPTLHLPDYNTSIIFHIKHFTTQPLYSSIYIDSTDKLHCIDPWSNNTYFNLRSATLTWPNPRNWSIQV